MSLDFLKKKKSRQALSEKSKGILCINEVEMRIKLYRIFF